MDEIVFWGFGLWECVSVGKGFFVGGGFVGEKEVGKFDCLGRSDADLRVSRLLRPAMLCSGELKSNFALGYLYFARLRTSF